MNITFKEITIKNFKGCLDLHLDFDDKRNILEGENGVGKTTVLDAITWCLFGKNFADESRFNIKPIIDGEEKPDLITSVELKMNDTSVERIWDGSNTVIKVDGTKFGVNEFRDYLRDKFLITDEEFKSLSNIDYIPNLHWKDLRSLIMGLIGEIKNEEVFATGDYSLIKDKIESVGIEKTAEDIKSTKSVLTNNIKMMQGNIDQKTKDIEELVVDEKETAELESRKEEIKKTIDEYNHLKEQKASQDKELNDLDNLKQLVKKSEEEVQKLKADNEEYQKTYDSSNIDINLIRDNKIKEIKNTISDENNEIARLDLEKTTLIDERADLRKKYDDEVNKTIKVENDTCSACGQPLPENKIEEVLLNLKEESKLKANGYAAKAKEKLTRIDDIDILINSHKDKIKNLENSIQEVMKEEIDPNQESEMQKKMKENIEKNNVKITELESNMLNFNEEIAELEVKIALHEQIEIKDTASLQNELEEITHKLAASDVLKKFKEQLSDLEIQYKKMMEEKETLNLKEQQLIEFNNNRAEILRNRVKHNFKLADFITQEETKDGKLVETFKISLDGIPFESLNTGHRILVALDLIDNIQRMKDKRLPILIDKTETVTRLPELDTQVIGCRAKFQTNRKLEVTH